MSNIIHFPAGHPIAAERIPREQFERLAGLALDVVDQILVLLNDAEGQLSTSGPISFRSGAAKPYPDDLEGD
ncbi:hypothetical protein [Methylobacterium platani]|uniref:Uncharacterized protein n=2 Tax=Methylobacterium platani TaxID=427683 RepID=A0A179RZU9_9HYPH|nr:hypothetical protein [Methylobacterium platani]KMO17564.1 hypothetical protein SQ03_12270 [Methylobacterium platani JCM 14648]OAS18181.1 hypothetical protein A5481_26925 [Methylobacterium platani]